MKKLLAALALILGLAAPARPSCLPAALGGTNNCLLTYSTNGWFMWDGSKFVASATGSAYQVLRVPSGGAPAAFGALDVSQSAAVTGALRAVNGGLGLDASASTGVPVATSGSFAFQNPLGVSSGGIGVATCAAHAVMIGEGTSPVTCLALAANAPLLGTSSADPHSSTVWLQNDTTATETITAPNSSNPASVVLKDSAGHAATLSRSTDATENISMTNQTISTPGDQYSWSNNGSFVNQWYSAPGGATSSTCVYIFSCGGTTNATEAHLIFPTVVDGSTRGIWGANTLFGQNQWSIYFNNSSTKFDIFTNGGFAHQIVTSSTVLTANATNLVVTYVDWSVPQFCIQINGGTAACATPNNSALATFTGGGSIYAGNSDILSTDQVEFVGRYDDAVGWNRTLTSTERTNLWNGGALQPYTSWPSGQVFRLRFEDASGLTTTDDITGITWTWANLTTGQGPTLQQTNLWPVVSPTMGTRAVWAHQTGASGTASQALYKVGDSNTGLYFLSLADEFNAQLAAGTVKLMADTNGVEVNGGLYLGAGTASTLFLANGGSKTYSSVNTGDHRVHYEVAGTGISLTPSGDSETIATSNVPLTAIATEAANTVVGNFTGSTASPTANAMTDCHGTGNYEIWTAATGFGCNTLVAGSNVTLTPSGSNLTIASTGGSGGTTTTNYYGSAVVLCDTTLTAAATTLSCTVPAGYADLSYTLTGQDTVGTTWQSIMLGFNGDTTAANYSAAQYVLGRISAATSSNVASATTGGFVCNFAGPTGATNVPTACNGSISNYAGTTFYKRNNSYYGNSTQSGDEVLQASFYWKSTAAITSMLFTKANTNFAIGTRLVVYGSGGTAGTTYNLNGSASAMVQINKVTAGSGDTSMTFSGIPANFNDLHLTCTYRGSTSTDVSLRFQVNGDSTSGDYSSQQYFNADGSSTSAGTNAATSNGILFALGAGTNASAGLADTVEIFAPGYSGTTFFKRFMFYSGEIRTSTQYHDLGTGSFLSTNAINQIKIIADAGSFASGSNCTLYGIGGQNGGGAVGGWVPLYDNTLTASTANVSVSSLPQGYRDLVVEVNGQATTNTVGLDDVIFEFNGDTTAGNYFRGQIYSVNGGTPSTGADANDNHFCTLSDVKNTASAIGHCVATIYGYSGSTFQKTANIVSGVYNTTGTNSLDTRTGIGKWANAAAITAVNLKLATGNFASGTHITIYGVPSSVVTASAIQQGAESTRPAASANGNLFHPTDGMTIDVDNGSTWNSWGPIFPLTVPPADTSTVTTTQGSNGGSITSGATSIVVSSATGFPASGNYMIIEGTEEMLVTGGQGTTTWTITRGYNGTTAASHTDGATITLENWEWVNQGSATTTQTTNGGIFMDSPSVSGGLFRHMRKRLIGSNTSLRIALIPAIFNSTSASVGFDIALRESSTGKAGHMYIGISSTAPQQISVEHVASPFGSGAGTGDYGPAWYVPTSPIFMRADLTGSNIVYYYSTDGQNWLLVKTVAKTTQFTTGPDEWGWGVYNNGTTTDIGATLISFKEQ